MKYKRYIKKLIMKYFHIQLHFIYCYTYQNKPFNTKPSIMKTRILLLLAVAILFACNKDDGDTVNNKPEQGLGDEQLAYWESLGADHSFTSDDLQFEDGTPMSNWMRMYESDFYSQYGRSAHPTQRNEAVSLSARLKSLIATYTYAAEWLIQDENFNFTDQTGIGYVWGSTQYLTKSACQHDHEKTPACGCTSYSNGLDCSGYIYQMFDISNLGIPGTGTTAYSATDLWQKALNKSASYNGLIIKNKGKLPFNQLMVGDIIDSPGHHIGIVGMVGGKKKIFNSLGSWKKTCMVNSDSKHGPIATPQDGNDFTQADVNKLFDKGNYIVLRFINPNVNYAGSTISGTLGQYNLNGSPNYNGSIQIINLSLQVEFNPGKTAVTFADFTSNSDSPNIPNFYSLGIFMSNEVTSSSVSNNQVSITFEGGATFSGTISGNTLTGNFSSPYIYTDNWSQETTNLTVATPITLTLR